MGYTLPSPNTPPSISDPRSNAFTLIARKSSIEAALHTQLIILTNNNADMHTPLLDHLGFPRADLDIVAIRSARVRILQLRNDLNNVIDDLKLALEDFHAENARNKNGDRSELQPFAKIDRIAPGSPAAIAGLQREDLILSFGSFTLSSLSTSTSTSTSIPAARLTPLVSLAASHEDRPLELKILRSSLPLTLTLTPSKWGGRGLLGCHIVPYTAPSPSP